MKLSKSRRSLNGWIEEHTNRKAESQQESVGINQNGMVEIKRSKKRIRSNGLKMKHMNREAASQRESVAVDQNVVFEMKHMNREAASQRESVVVDQNGIFEMKHMNREAESQRESVAIHQNGMVERKQKDRKKTTGGARRQNSRRLNCNTAITMFVKMLIWFVNVGMFGNGFFVKNLISKRFKCRRIQIKMVEVKDEFVVKNENTETNGIAIQPNKMQKGLERWNIEEKRGAANENDHGTQGMPKERKKSLERRGTLRGSK